jgi:hypothetical protein
MKLRIAAIVALISIPFLVLQIYLSLEEGANWGFSLFAGILLALAAFVWVVAVCVVVELALFGPPKE